MSLRSWYGVAGWPASMAMPNTSALFLRTSHACPFSAAVGQTISRQQSNLGYSRTLTAVLANWKLATQVSSGWWHCGLIAMLTQASSILRWSGLSQQCHRCKSPIWCLPRMPGCCGTAWEIPRIIQRMQERTWRKITLILRKWRGSSRRWKATSIGISDWIYQQEVWLKSPQHWDQPNLMARSRYHQ